MDTIKHHVLVLVFALTAIFTTSSIAAEYNFDGSVDFVDDFFEFDLDTLNIGNDLDGPYYVTFPMSIPFIPIIIFKQDQRERSSL